MEFSGDSRPDVIVVGAGIVGLSAAFSLQLKGYSVLLLDRKGPAAEASRGNAGAFAFSDIIPLATPGIMRKAPRWLLDPLGPLSVPPRYAFRLLPWMLRFWRACRPERVESGIFAQTDLMNLSKHALLPFLRKTGTGSMLRRDGNLQVYESRAEFEASLPYWDARERCDIPFEHVHGSYAISEYQPGLDRRFVSATFTPEWYSISDPLEYALTIADIFDNRGGRIEIGEAVAIFPRNDGASVRCADGREFAADKVVICAGAWSHKLAQTLGERIPLETERGYNTTLPNGEFDLRTQLTFGAHGFVVSRLSSGIRVGGAVELGGLSAPPNFQRADVLLAKAKSFLPDLVTEGGTQWMGFRPSLPDTLPVISPSRKSDNVIYAFGHGHLGLTQSAGTAMLVTDLVEGEDPSIDIHPFRADRF
ncbi:FAD-binding oxidoreductase [Nitratireductor sp. XY-223]|uniref:NAD(P)/FAD-dependent oxidoreductase n=1 Tax=Nitratireductor sp. XY-223 TaxID=2561926 RepID=UPI0010A9ABFB|nr:FAD-binding oxidoreductase [Nitratireductor sp. XY-223]